MAVKKPESPLATLGKLFRPCRAGEAADAKMTTEQLWRLLRDYLGEMEGITDNEIMLYLKKQKFTKAIGTEKGKAVVLWQLKNK